MYDPVMSTFLSVDAYVQDPTSAQGFNRYAYCSHNPLRYVDPTGWSNQPFGNPNVAPPCNPIKHTTYSSNDPIDMLWGYGSFSCSSSSGSCNGNDVTPSVVRVGNENSETASCGNWIYDTKSDEYIWDGNVTRAEDTPDGFEFVGHGIDDVKQHFLDHWNNDYYHYWVYGITYGENRTAYPGEISAPNALSAFEMWMESEAQNFPEGLLKISVKIFYDMVNSPFSLFTGHTLAGHQLTTSEKEEAYVDVVPGVLMKGMEVTSQVVKVSSKLGYSDFCEKVKITNYNQSFKAYQINNKTQQSVSSFNLFKNYSNHGKEIYKKYQKK